MICKFYTCESGVGFRGKLTDALNGNAPVLNKDVRARIVSRVTRKIVSELQFEEEGQGYYALVLNAKNYAGQFMMQVFIRDNTGDRVIGEQTIDLIGVPYE